MSKNLLILFVKNLIPGTVKTRLAEEIGIEGALDVYQYLVEHTFEETKKLSVEKSVYYSDYVEAEDIFDEGDFLPQIQTGTGLGERMQNAFERSFDAGYDRVIIIGSDCFQLKEGHVEEAFDELDDHDLVIGPATDGGFYLIGMKKSHPSLFKDKTYSHSGVLKELLVELSILNLSFHLLPDLNDIDTFQDLKDSDIDFEFVSDDE